MGWSLHHNLALASGPGAEAEGCACAADTGHDARAADAGYGPHNTQTES